MQTLSAVRRCSRLVSVSFSVLGAYAPLRDSLNTLGTPKSYKEAVYTRACVDWRQLWGIYTVVCLQLVHSFFLACMLGT